MSDEQFEKLMKVLKNVDISLMVIVLLITMNTCTMSIHH